MPIEIKKNDLPKLVKALETLADMEVLVGIPAENAGREPQPGEVRTPLNNAELGYIHEFGGTIQHPGGTEYVIDEGGKARFVKSGTTDGTRKTGPHAIDIPPRPWLRPGVEEAKDKIAKALLRGAKAVVAGNPDGARDGLDGAGLVAQASVMNKLTNGPFTPLASSTLAKRRARGITRTNPLNDSGAMRNSVKYAIVKKDD